MQMTMWIGTVTWMTCIRTADGQQGSREPVGWDLGQRWEVVVYDSIAARAGASSHSFPGLYLHGCLSLLRQEVLRDKHIEQNKNVIFALVGTRGGF